MNGYVEAGYLVVVASLAGYSVRVVGRRRRLERLGSAGTTPTAAGPATTTQDPP